MSCFTAIGTYAGSSYKPQDSLGGNSKTTIIATISPANG